MDRIAIVKPWPSVNEGDSFTVDLYFVDRAGEELEAPSTVDYRVDDLDTGTVIRSWTTATVGTSSSIALASADSALVSRYHLTETRLLTVRANRDASSQVSGRTTWVVNRQDFYP